MGLEGREKRVWYALQPPELLLGRGGRVDRWGREAPQTVNR
jgi:hypothetical protein